VHLLDTSPRRRAQQTVRTSEQLHELAIAVMPMAALQAAMIGSGDSMRQVRHLSPPTSVMAATFDSLSSAGGSVWMQMSSEPSSWPIP
jgi:hypothetical protein